MSHIIDLILHLDKHLGQLITDNGVLSYLILSLVVFCETGLVVTPFLPGDSLLFAAGALCASLGILNIHLLVLLLCAAAIIGDALNYTIGSRLGMRAFSGDPQSSFLRRFIFRDQYLQKTQRFYEKYGAKTIIIARFVPIVRTFAPFLAGVGKMSYSRFALYNVTGGILWVLAITYAGYFFGEIPVVKNNFGLVVIGIIAVSLLPIAIEIVRARLDRGGGATLSSLN